MALISDLPNATPQKSDLMEIQNGQTSSNNSSVGQLMQLSASENLAPAYDASAGVYAVGDFVSYNGTLYQCNTAIATPEAFDATKWTAKKVVDMTGSDIAVSDTDSTTIADKLVNVPTFDTLTTSDNNKLLGVSVSGSDISVGAVTAGAVFNAGNIYSNSETVCGVWTDNNPIYRKVIPFSNVTITNNAWTTLVTVTGATIALSARMITSGDEDYMGMPLYFKISNKTINVFNNLGGNIPNKSGQVIVEYLKT